MKRLVRPALGAAVLLALAVTPVAASHGHVQSLGAGALPGPRRRYAR